MFEHLHSSRMVKDEKIGLTIISDLQNNFDLSYLLMSNVSIERVQSFTVLLQHLTTFYSFKNCEILSNLNLVQKLQQKTV